MVVQSQGNDWEKILPGRCFHVSCIAQKHPLCCQFLYLFCCCFVFLFFVFVFYPFTYDLPVPGHSGFSLARGK